MYGKVLSQVKSEILRKERSGFRQKVLAQKTRAHACWKPQVKPRRIVLHAKVCGRVGRCRPFPFCARTVCLVEELAMANLDWSRCSAVESIPGKVSGAWVLKGTRMPVSAIFENLEAGANIDDIMVWFDGLDRDQVRAVIEFAARSLDSPPAYAS